MHLVPISLLTTLIVLAFALDFGRPPIWFQPCCVGFLWGSSFFAGFMVRGTKSSILTCVLNLLLLFAAGRALESLTDLGMGECRLLTACIAFAGWLAAQKLRMGEPTRISGRQIRIAELGFLTVLAAFAAQAVPDLSGDSPILLSVSAAMIGGIPISWFASRWIWRDQWSCSDFSPTLGSICAAVACVTAAEVIGQPTQTQISWELFESALVGPINVIASQGTLVLLLLAIVRAAIHTPSPLPH